MDRDNRLQIAKDHVDTLVMMKVITEQEGTKRKAELDETRKEIATQADSTKRDIAKGHDDTMKKNSGKEKECIDYRFVHVPPEKLIELVDGARDVLAEVALAEDIPYIDLNKHIGQDLVNLTDQIHLTVKGNKAVAEYLAQQWDQIWQQNK